MGCLGDETRREQAATVFRASTTAAGEGWDGVEAEVRSGRRCDAVGDRRPCANTARLHEMSAESTRRRASGTSRKQAKAETCSLRAGLYHLKP